jgi:hypothetical protein
MTTKDNATLPVHDVKRKEALCRASNSSGNVPQESTSRKSAAIFVQKKSSETVFRFWNIGLPRLSFLNTLIL